MHRQVKCTFCGKIFCCAKCRIKHEDLKHVEIKKIILDCSICNGAPFLLNINNKKLMEHIIEKHLPLHCKKCSKVILISI